VNDQLVTHPPARPAVEVPGLVARTTWLEGPGDPLASLGPGGFAWFGEGWGFATAGEVARIPLGPGPDRLERAAALVGGLLGGAVVDDEVRLAGTGPLAVGALGFSPGDAGALVVPARVVGIDPEGRRWVTECAEASGGDPRPRPAVPPGAAARGPVAPSGSLPTGPAGAASPGRLPTGSGGRDAFVSRVRAVLDRIEAGAVSKVVVARQEELEGSLPYAVATVVERLRRQQPGCFVYASAGFVGASPELLVRRRGRVVESRPMAGTVPRASRPADDDLRASWLTSSPKEREEHLAVVGAVTGSLASVAHDLEVRGPELARFPSVCHLVSTVRAEVDAGGPSALALAGLLHPTPAVAGLPVAEALAVIAELEPFPRGCYAGPVGWVDGRGDGEWAVAIRCAELQGRRAVLTAGAGIVAGSGPATEWAETEAKLAPMRAALAES